MSFVQVPPDSTGKKIATHQIGDEQQQIVSLANSSGVEIAPLTDTQLRASPVPVSAAALPLPTGAATETTLAALNGKIVSSATMPDQNAVALYTRQAPQKYFDASFPQVGAGILSPRFTQIGATGTGMAINQSAGNLVITTGTTANAELTLRSTQSFTGALTIHQLTTLSQRIVNNNFFIELVDVIGDGLAYTIVNATTVDVTLTGHGYTAANVGQRMDIGVITGAAGIPMEAVIASIPNANTIRFTVAGWPASGSGTCSLTGWNKIELLYTGTSATALNFNTRRQGWQNTSVAAAINTSASGHITATNVCNGVAALSDQVNTSAGVYANRATWRSNIPEPEVVLFLQLRARNGTAPPASTTTWTMGFVRVEDYVPIQADIVGTKVQSSANSLLVSVISAPTTTVTGTVTANIGTGALAAGANAIGDVGLQVRANATGAATAHHFVAAASTNALNIKAGAGRVLGWCLANTTASWRYVKLHNNAGLPTAGAGVVQTIGIPPNGLAQMSIPQGLAFATGIARTCVTGAADADATATAANDVVGDIYFA
jgi:hypothetical protein